MDEPRKIAILEVDWNRLSDCYRRLNWKWYDGLPNPGRIKEAVARLTRYVGEEAELVDGRKFTITEPSSGGLTTDGASIWLDKKLEDEYFIVSNLN